MKIPPRRGSFVPRRNPIQNIPNLTLGLMDRQNPIEIPPIAMADCENVTVDEGTIRSASGWIGLTFGGETEAGPYYGAVHFKNSAGTVQRVIRLRQNKLEYSTAGYFSYVWTDCTLPSSGSPATAMTLTDGEYPSFAILNDTLVMTNGVDPVITTTDGINWSYATYGSPATSLPLAKQVINNGRNRLLYVSDSSNPSRIDWTSINNPTELDGFQLIEPNDGQEITGVGMTPWGSVLIFKDSNIYEMGDITGGAADIQIVAKNVSLANHRTIQTTENSVIFMGYDGIYEYIGGTTRYLFGEIKKTGRNTVLNNKTFTSGYFNRKYHLSMPDANISQNYNAQEYIVDKNMSGPSPSQPYSITRSRRYVGMYWTEDKPNTPVSNYRSRTLNFGDSRSPSGSPLSGATNFGYINSYDLTAAAGFTQGLNGAAQSCYFTTKFFTNDEFYYEKKYKKFYFVCKAEESITFTVAYRFDPYEQFQEYTQQITSQDLDWVFESAEEGEWTFESAESGGWAISSISHNFIDIENSSNVPRGIQFKISWSSVNTVEIIDMGFMFRPKNKFK